MRNNILYYSVVLVGIKRLFFHVMPLVIGIFNLRHFRTISSAAYPLIGMFIVSIIISMYMSSLDSFVRSFQFLLLVSFFDFVLRNITIEKIKLYIYSPAIVALIVLIYDLVVGNFIPASKNLFGFDITRRYWGVTNEPNFSAAALGILFLLCMHLNKKKLATVYLLLCIPTMSRNIIIMLVVFTFFSFVYRYLAQFLRGLSFAFVIFSILLPMTIGYIDDQIQDRPLLQYKLSILTSERNDLYARYRYMFLENPMGVGLMNGKKLLAIPNKKYSFYKHLEQHNLFVQILTEFGIVGFILWAFFITKMILISTRINLVYLMSILSLYVFMNGIFDPLIYLGFGLLYGKSPKAQVGRIELNA